MSSSIPVDIDDEDEDEEAHEINVTPFIDVMLVLLIIFMVVAPLSTVDLPVDLPSATAIQTKRPDKPIYVTIKADLGLAVGESQHARRAGPMAGRNAGGHEGQPHFPSRRPFRAV